jgi:hypothetical protein
MAIWTRQRHGSRISATSEPGSYARLRETADSAQGVVEHRVESTTLPELIEEDPARPFTSKEDKLTLGDNKTYRRRFRRARPSFSNAGRRAPS